MRSALLLASAAAAAAADPWNCTTQPAGAFAPIRLTNARGTELRILPYGGTATHFIVKDANGQPRDILLGFDDYTQYCANAVHPYFGATIGRVANRIANCSFTLEGTTYHTPCNEASPVDGNDTLHGGTVGFDRRVWTISSSTASSVRLSYFSPDGEEGFPGDVHVNVTHTLTPEDAWTIEYSAATTSAVAVASLTNHAYWNLNSNVNGTATILEHELFADAGRYLVVDSALLPTGAVGDVRDAFWLDFQRPKPVGRDIRNGTVTPTGEQLSSGVRLRVNESIRSVSQRTLQRGVRLCPAELWAPGHLASPCRRLRQRARLQPVGAGRAARNAAHRLLAADGARRGDDGACGGGASLGRGRVRPSCRAVHRPPVRPSRHRTNVHRPAADGPGLRPVLLRQLPGRDAAAQGVPVRRRRARRQLHVPALGRDRDRGAGLPRRAAPRQLPARRAAPRPALQADDDVPRLHAGFAGLSRWSW
jgi:galactose mutarotase-like enzyme